MSRIKELKLNPENNINIVDVFKILCPEGKTKYVEFLIKLTKNTKNIEKYLDEINENMERELGVNVREHFKEMTPFQIWVAYRFLDVTFNFNDLRTFQKFCDYNERGLIKNNDLSKYSSFDEVMVATGIAELKVNEKELEKQIKVIYDSDNEWIVLRPLTFLSSKKYGSSTKWCTTSENNSEYFLRYAKRGILLYMINKSTGVKVACFKSLDVHDPELSFWNQVDSRIDSLESGLPNYIMDVIRKELSENLYTNYSMLSDEDKKKEEQLYENMKKREMDMQPVPVDEIPMVEEERPEHYLDGIMSEQELEESRAHFVNVTNNEAREVLRETVREMRVIR